MNERIRELYKQAQVPYTAIDPSNNMPYETTCFSADKFAELIIRECARAVDQVYEAAEPDHGCYDWATWAYGSDVLEHFELDKPA